MYNKMCYAGTRTALSSPLLAVPSAHFNAWHCVCYRWHPHRAYVNGSAFLAVFRLDDPRLDTWQLTTYECYRGAYSNATCHAPRHLRAAHELVQRAVDMRLDSFVVPPAGPTEVSWHEPTDPLKCKAAQL